MFGVTTTQDTRCLMSLIGLLASMEKMVPEGCLHIGPSSFISRSTGDILSRWTASSLDRSHFCTPRLVAKSHKCDIDAQMLWDIDALNLNWTGLTAYAYPPMALLHRVIQKIRQCLIIVIAPGWPEMPWFWIEIPLQLPVSTTLLKQCHNYVFHSNPQHLNLHAWCLGVDSSKTKASLWGLAERIAAPQRSSTGALFLHSICETNLRLFHVPVPRSKQAPLDH